jgi:hypothetical protein
MSTTTVAAIYDLAMSGFFINDSNIAQGSTNVTAVRINGECIRVVGGASNAGIVMPAILSGEALSVPYFVINDGPNTIKVYASSGESINGSALATANLSIAAGAIGVFFPVPNHHGGSTDWRCAAIA